MLKFTAITLLLLAPSAVAAPPVSAPPTGWTLAFEDNARLPPGFRQFTIPRPDGTAQTGFIADVKNHLSQRQPLLVFVDGSGAHSQFFYSAGRRGYGVYGALAQSGADRYHVVTADKRGVTFGEVPEQVGTAVTASAEYNTHATFESRVAEMCLLIDALLKQPNVDAGRVVLLGHSEGADVAAGVAAAEPRVTHVAFLSGGGPTQLFDLIVLRRKEMTAAGARPEEIERSVAELEASYRDIYDNPDSLTKQFAGHAYRRWASFCSHPPVDSLLKSRAKLFLAHGSEDKAVPVESFDLLVVDLIRHGRRDVTARRFPGRDHSLAPPGAGRNDMPLGDIFEEIIRWAGCAPASAAAPPRAPAAG